MPDPYNSTDLAELLLRSWYPEKTTLESKIIRDFLLAHGREYDRFEFSVRVGQGQTPPADYAAGIQQMIAHNTRKRIDVIAWKAGFPTIVEVKNRVVPAVLGQLQTYRQLYLEDHPELDDVGLLAIGRYSDDDTLRVLNAAGVPVLLYELPATG